MARRPLLPAALVALTALVLALWPGKGDSQVSAGDPRPQDPVLGIVAAFRDHPLVAIGESHDLAQFNAFLRKLVSDPGFLRETRTIVVESGNARHQRLVDRYLAGVSMPVSRLRPVWRDLYGAFGLTPDEPHERFYRTLRAVNARLPAGRRLRVVLGDSPIDWSRIRRRLDLRRFDRSRLGDRDAFYTARVEREVLARKGKALLIVGGSHLTLDRHSVGGLLEQRHPGATWRVRVHTDFGHRDAALEGRMAVWPQPAYAELAGTWLHQHEGESFHAMLWFGPHSALTQDVPSYEQVREPGLWKELRRRTILRFGRWMPGSVLPALDVRYPKEPGDVVQQPGSPPPDQPEAAPLP
jgi:hypothetical protein